MTTRKNKIGFPTSYRPLGRKPADGGWNPNTVRPISIPIPSTTVEPPEYQERIEALEDKVQALEEAKSIVEDNLARTTEMLESMLNDMELLQAEVRRYATETQTYVAQMETQIQERVKHFAKNEYEVEREKMRKRKGWG